MNPPRVLVVLDTVAAWSRGILRGFMAAAHERGWTLLHYSPLVDLNWVADEWAPDAAGDRAWAGRRSRWQSSLRLRWSP